MEANILQIASWVLVRLLPWMQRKKVDTNRVSGMCAHALKDTYNWGMG
jgi:hypothetical protein